MSEVSNRPSIPHMSYLRDEEHRINVLATFNSEVARGIVHTDEWREFMAIEQAWLDERNKREIIAAGGYETSPGVWLIPKPPKRRWWAFR